MLRTPSYCIYIPILDMIPQMNNFNLGKCTIRSYIFLYLNSTATKYHFFGILVLNYWSACLHLEVFTQNAISCIIKTNKSNMPTA